MASLMRHVFAMQLTQWAPKTFDTGMTLRVSETVAVINVGQWQSMVTAISRELSSPALMQVPLSSLHNSATVKRWWRSLLSIAVRIVVPLLLASLICWYLVVPPALARDPISAMAGRWGHQFPVVFFLVCTVACMVIGRQAWQSMSKVAGSSEGSVEVKGQSSSVSPRRFGLLRNAISTAVLAIGAASAALALRAYAFESHRILSQSMLPSLMVGDQVLVNKLAYGWKHSLGIGSGATIQPNRGQLVVFHFVDEDGNAELVLKRVVGIAGDRLKMLGNTPNINGWNVPFCDVGPYANVIDKQFVVGRVVVEFLENESYLTLHTMTSREPYKEEYSVKAGELFVLGDHRSESLDSRAWNQGKGGGVPVAAVEGRIERFLVGTTRSGALEFSRFFQAPQGLVAIEGIDTSALSDAIRKCLANRPKDTFPPPTSNVVLAAR